MCGVLYRMKLKLILPDYLMIIAILFMFGCHFTTHFLIAQSTTMAETREQAEKVIDYVEKNPVTALLFKLGGLKYIYTEILVPGMLVGMYYFFRRKFGYDGAMGFAMMAVMVFLMNFINDFAYLMAYGVQYGWFG